MDQVSPLLSRLRLFSACICLLSSTIAARAATNDMFADAIDLGSTTSAEVSFRAADATRQVGEPSQSFPSTKTVWWRWTAPTDGELRITCSKAAWSTCGLYTGTTINALTQAGALKGQELTATVSAGTTYHLVIGAESSGTFSLKHYTPPPNDDFANRTQLGSPPSFQIDASTYAASHEAGEPGINSNNILGPSIWWSWQAPQDGLIRFDLGGSPDEDWNIRIYTGSTLAGLTERLNRPYSADLTSVSRFRVRAGEIFAITAMRWDPYFPSPASGGKLRLNWSLTPQPYGGDTSADSIDLGTEMTVVGSGDNTGTAAMWWKWTAPIDGVARWQVSAQPSAYTTLSVYDSNLNLIVGNSPVSSVDFPCQPGNLYYLRLSTPGKQGAYAFQLSVQASPPNDDVVNAAPLNPGENSYTTVNATRESTEPSTSWLQSVWWEWTAPAAGALSLDFPPRFFYKLVVYEKAADGTLSQYQETYDRLLLHTTPSQRYLIGVVRWDTTTVTGLPPTGSFSALFTPAQTSNDAFDDAIDFGSATRGEASGDPTAATVEAGEPVHNLATPPRSLWWKWTAPAAGHFVLLPLLRNQLFENETGLKAYRGTTLSTLSPLGSVVAPGDVIYIAVTQQANNPVRQVNFKFDFIPLITNDAVANAIDLGSTSTINFPTTLSTATIEANEPPHTYSGTAKSLWWKWTAPGDLNVDISLWNEYERIANVDFYQQNESGGLILIQRRSDLHAVTAGTTYYLSLFSQHGYSGTLRMTANQPPPGDHYDHPVDLGSASPALMTMPSEEGTMESRDPNFPLYDYGSESFWWRWTAPAAGIFSGNFNASNWQISREDTPGIWTPVPAPVTVQAGQSLRIVGCRGGMGGVSPLTARFGAFQPNDLRANATDLGSATTASASSLLRATSVEAGEQSLVPNYPYQLNGTAWWSWTAPFNGALRITALVQATETGVAILSGPSAASASLVTSARGLTYNPAETIIPVTAGNRYWIMVGSCYANQDDLTTLSLEAWPTPSNDHWQAATDLGNAEHAEGEGRNENAIRESFEPTGRYSSVWWKWTAPRTGNAIVSADIANYANDVISVYRDSGSSAPVAVATRPPVTGTLGTMSLFRADAGVTYFFSVATTEADIPGRSIHISVDFTDSAPNDDFAAATMLSGTLPLSFTGNSRASTWEASEPETPGYGGSLWWNWTAPSSGRVLITREGGYSLHAYTGTSLGALTLVAHESSYPWLAWQVTAGVTYRLRVAGEGLVSLRLEAVTPPANDLFANRQSLGTTSAASLTAHNVFATAETSEPAHAGTAAARSIWYRWTPATTGRYEIDTSASGLSDNLSLSLRVAVYRGTSLTALTSVASGTSRVGFTATAGVEHVFAVDNSEYTPVSIEIRPSSTPANDNFANRTVLSGKSFTIAATDNFGATVQSGEPLPGTSTQYPGSLWWEWTAPLTGTVAMTRPFVHGGTPALTVRTSSSATPVFGNLTSVGSQFFSVTAGSRYFFQVAFPQSSQSGVSFRYEGAYSYIASFVSPPAFTPPNDRFGTWTDIGQALGLDISGDVYGSTMEANQTSGALTGSIGWKWTAPSSGWFMLRRQTSSVPVTLRLLRGTTWSTITVAASGSGEYVWFEATAGESLWIEWQSSFITEIYLNSPQRFVSFVILPAGGAPANDVFANPQALPAGLTGSISGNTFMATAEAGEPTHGGTAATRSVWYEWTASATGIVNLSASSATMRAGVYTGTSLNTLEQVAAGTEPLVFSAIAGTTYRIALDSINPASFSVTLRDQTPATNDAFANSTLVAGTNGSTAAILRNSTVEAGEPVGASSSDNASIWWHWTAPATGPVTWQSSSSLVNVAAYTGASIDQLRVLFAASGQIRFHAIAGTTYHIRTSTSQSNVDFTLAWQQQTTAPANDNFANAVVLPEAPANFAGTLVSSSREVGEPRHSYTSSPARGRSVWYAWTAPATGVFRVTAANSAAPEIWVYQGGALDLLDPVISGTGALDLTAVVGTTYHIAVIAQAEADELPFQFTITTKDYGNNDLFANRTHLGNASQLAWEGTTKMATKEHGEPYLRFISETEGTRWWSWTAPANGAAILRRSVPASDYYLYLGVYTGTSLTDLVEVDSTRLNVLAFPVTAGTTYHFQVGGDFDFAIELSMAPLEHDNFEDPLVLFPALAISSEIPANGASTQMGETGNGRSVWWRWVAPADGWVDLDSRASDFAATLWVGQGNALPHLTPVTLATVGDGIRRFFAKAGTAYSISAGSTSESSFGLARLTLSPTGGTGPANDNFATALALTGESATVPATSRGATLETEEYILLSKIHLRSLWWTWTAPRDGVLTVKVDSGWNLLYEGSALGSLVPVGPLGGVPNVYAVVAGQSYRIAAGNSAGSDFILEFALSPQGDIFSQPLILTPAQSLVIASSLTGCSYENGEPYHGSLPAFRSRWFQWTAPATGPFRIVADGGTSALRVAVYSGAAVTSLTSRGKGTEATLFNATAGQTYHIAVDAASNGTGGDFRLSIAPEPMAYTAWREAHFESGDPTGGPDSDPDGDGRANLIELLLGSNPAKGDSAAPFQFSTTAGPVHLQVRHVSNLNGWHIGFDVSPTLASWVSSDEIPNTRWTEDHGDGTATLHVILSDYDVADFPTLLFRLRVEAEKL